ncbi:MAG: DUF3488 domain-containing protein [Planctomycetota bacterium]|nr:MAG: DUF3488 domain-containing protein [Planctomycetota bacterium]GDY06712.1 hypothetical protein LBMAG52_01980 [Planctomycetia bacterium]
MTTALQLSLYGLVMLASGMLALAEGTAFPDAFTIPMALLALFLTERWKLFQLRVRWANVLGLAAFGLAGWELSSGQIEARLLSLAHLLVYLTWIVLFVDKTPRMSWNLCLLSVLHVAVGAVLTSSGAFGLMCVVFLIAAVWTLTVFTVSRVRQRYDDEDAVLFATHREGDPPRRTAELNRAESADEFLWNQRSRPISTVQIDPRLRWISGAFVSGVLANVMLSAVVGMLFFVFTPRIWVGSFSAFGEAPDLPLRALQSGFAEEVQLGDIGQILEGTNTVLEVRMFDHSDNQPIDIVAHATRLGFDEPLFRGSVLGEYANGKWRVGTTGRRDGPRHGLSPTPTSDCIRQEFRMEPMDSGILFALPQHLAGALEHRLPLLTERRVTSVLYRDESVTGRERLQYKIYSEKPRPEVDLPFPRGTHLTSIYADELGYYRALPAGLERLQNLARQIAVPTDAPNSTPTEMARRILQHLRDSGEFGYTLDMSVNDPSIDAVEDFLFNRKQGHCEYFASALGLMLRAVNIPARLVSGFKGGDRNPSTGYFVVQGRHAHVWVEALLDGRWRVLDATPASRSDSVKSLAPKLGLFGTIADMFSNIWSHHIVGLSFNDQSDNVYAPLKEIGTTAWEGLQESIEDFLNGENASEGSSRRRSQIIAGLTIAAVLSVLVGTLLLAARSRMPAETRSPWFARLQRFLNWLLPDESIANNGDGWRARWSRWWSRLLRRLRGESAEQRLRVEFYERFLRLLRSAGLEPLPAQTAHEFLIASQSAWSQRLAADNSVRLPADVVTQFYRVRFGGESLSSDELQQIESQLGQMEQQWSDRNGRR